MNAKMPELRDFGITPNEYALYTGRVTDLSGLAVFLGLLVTAPLVVFWVAFLVEILETAGLGSTIWITIVVGILPGIFVVNVVGTLIDPAIVRFKRKRLLKSPIASQIRLYEDALAAYNRERWEAERAEKERLEAEREREREQLEAEQARRRKLVDHWMSLSGPEFERELGIVYRRLGYLVESTAGSGDGGVDLILRKNGKAIVVQCKSHQAPVGPAIARELFGAMVASRADSAILACTGGFTRGVLEFVQGKPITLISASELVSLAEGFEDNSLGETSGPPTCPTPGCGKTMVARTGRYGWFWSCPRFPKCKGSRPMSGTRE